jgi:hypothetical protein
VSYEFRFREIFKSLNKYFFIAASFWCTQWAAVLETLGYMCIPSLRRIVLIGPESRFFCSSRSQAPDRTLQEAMLGVNLEV